MNSRLRIRWLVAVWVVVGIFVAVSQDYDRRLDTASDWATFVMAVVVWPIPAIGGDVVVRL
jgi:hypothetical protein